MFCVLKNIVKNNDVNVFFKNIAKTSQRKGESTMFSMMFEGLGTPKRAMAKVWLFSPKRNSSVFFLIIWKISLICVVSMMFWFPILSATPSQNGQLSTDLYFFNCSCLSCLLSLLMRYVLEGGAPQGDLFAVLEWISAAHPNLMLVPPSSSLFCFMCEQWACGSGESSTWQCIYSDIRLSRQVNITLFVLTRGYWGEYCTAVFAASA